MVVVVVVVHFNPLLSLKGTVENNFRSVECYGTNLVAFSKQYVVNL